MADPIILYTDAFWISPYVFSCFVGLREKGLSFTTEAVALQKAEQRRPDYQDKTLTGRVPALRHGDFWLAESSAIIEYLDEAFPGPRLLPQGLRERARARQVLGWIRSDLLALREERPTSTMFYERATAPLSPAGQAAADKLLQVAELLVPAGKTALFGTWSVADADLGFMLQRLGLNGHELKPKLRAYVDAQWKHRAVREFVERERPLYVPY